MVIFHSFLHAYQRVKPWFLPVFDTLIQQGHGAARCLVSATLGSTSWATGRSITRKGTEHDSTSLGFIGLTLKQIWLVVWTPLKNISQLGWLFPIYGKIKNVPNHQPEIIVGTCWYKQCQATLMKLLGNQSAWQSGLVPCTIYIHLQYFYFTIILNSSKHHWPIIKIWVNPCQPYHGISSRSSWDSCSSSTTN